MLGGQQPRPWLTEAEECAYLVYYYWFIYNISQHTENFPGTPENGYPNFADFVIYKENVRDTLNEMRDYHIDVYPLRNDDPLPPPQGYSSALIPSARRFLKTGRRDYERGGPAFNEFRSNYQKFVEERRATQAAQQQWLEKYSTGYDLFSPLDPAQPCVAWLANWMTDGYPGTPWQWYQEHMQSPLIRSGDSWIYAPYICPCFKPDGTINDSPVILHTESTYSNHWLCPVCGQVYHRYY